MRHAHRAELQLAMVAQDQVFQMPLQRLFQTGFSQVRLQHFNAQHEVPQQTALISVVIGDTARKFAQFANIVKQRSRKKGLPVKFRIMVGDAAAKFEYAQSVLKQPAHIGVMHPFGRRTDPKGGAHLVVVKKSLYQLAPGRVDKFLFDEVKQFIQHLIQRKGAGGHKGRMVHSGAFLIGKKAHLLHRELHLIAVQPRAPFGPHKGSRRDFAELRAQRMPYLGFKAAAGISQGKPPVRAVARLPLRRLRNHEYAARLRGGANIFDVTTFFHISFQRRAFAPGICCFPRGHGP